MKKLLLSMVLTLVLTISWVFASNSQMKSFDFFGCNILTINTSCGGSYETQYCTGGSHGTLQEWIMQVDSWDCD